MARRDLTGAVDFAQLESYAGHDPALVEEVLGLFVEQARLWGPMLDAEAAGVLDSLHTIKGTARAVGAEALASTCAEAETTPGALRAGLGRVRTALDAALADIAAYRHEQALQGLRAR